jgi:hypothetical protein
MERRPWRTLLSIGGVAAAVAIVILGNFFRDAIDTIVDTQFNAGDAQRRGGVDTSSRWPTRRGELLRLPGVRAAESTPLRARDLVTATAASAARSAATPPRARAVPRGRRRQPRAAAARRRTGADRPPGDKLGCSVGDACRPRCWKAAPRTLRCVVERHGARDDGPERLHEPRGAQPRAGRRRHRQRLRAGAGPGRRGRLLEATRRCRAWPGMPSARPACCATWRRSARATSAS